MAGYARKRYFSSHGLATITVLSAVLIGGSVFMIRMPGSSVHGPLPDPTSDERSLAVRLEADVRALAAEIGERNMHTPGSMEQTASWIEGRLRDAGHDPVRHTYELDDGRAADNLIVEIPGTARPGEIFVIGAHYDTVPGSPGANDNASGVAALLALADHFRTRPRAATLRFIAFANEEMPFYTTPEMGSYSYAGQVRDRGDQIVAMLAMDGLGYFDERSGSQHYPLPGLGLVYPGRADFIGFVSRLRDAALVRRAISAFRDHATVASEGAALPGVIPGIGWSDHWSFWQHGYPAILVTDTLPFRDPDYHSPADTPERLDYDRMARVVAGLKAVVEELAR